jgi:hypothetical protein
MNVQRGGCLCGAVRYEVSGQPVRTGACHCRYCQQRTGSAFGISHYFDADAVRFNDAPRSSYTHHSDESGRTLQQDFCPRCGSVVSWVAEAIPGARAIAGGSLDNPDAYPVRRHIWLRSAHAWVEPPAEVDQYLMGSTPAPVFDFQPTLQGPTVTLRPQRADDFEPMYAVASDPLMWALHPEKDRWQRPVFEQLFASGSQGNGALTIVQTATGRVIGSSRYYDWNPHKAEVVIGYTYLARDQWGGAVNRELKRLMLQHAYGYARKVWFHVGIDNLRSRRAMEKIGAQRSHHISLPNLSGIPRDMVVYVMRAPQLPGEG